MGYVIKADTGKNTMYFGQYTELYKEFDKAYQWAKRESAANMAKSKLKTFRKKYPHGSLTVIPAENVRKVTAATKDSKSAKETKPVPKTANEKQTAKRQVIKTPKKDMAVTDEDKRRAEMLVEACAGLLALPQSDRVTLSVLLSETDLAEQDVLHKIEFSDSTEKDAEYTKKLRDIRKHRRDIKNAIALMERCREMNERIYAPRELRSWYETV